MYGRSYASNQLHIPDTDLLQDVPQRDDGLSDFEDHDLDRHGQTSFRPQQEDQNDSTMKGRTIGRHHNMMMDKIT
jgi:hypothetical protein